MKLKPACHVKPSFFPLPLPVYGDRVASEASRVRGNFRNLSIAETNYVTPSFFCRLVDDVVYWKTSFLSGKT
jgi:hypothetical protein